jgi:hypothetical protein
VLKALIDKAILSKEKIENLWSPIICYSDLTDNFIDSAIVFLNQFFWLAKLGFEGFYLYLLFTNLSHSD